MVAAALALFLSAGSFLWSTAVLKARGEQPAREDEKQQRRDAEEEKTKTDKAESAKPGKQETRLKKLIEESVEWYQVLPKANARKSMSPQTVLRWINASRGRDGEDILVLWIQDGRPEVAATIFPQKGYLHHELVSLSRGSQLVVKDGDAVAWSPSVAGVEFRDVPEAPAPAETPAARLRQMKSMAERFKATLTGLHADNSDREELRRLPREVYRYALKHAKRPDPALQDGAVFAYVQGTDPEVLLLLEAVRKDERWRWQYGFARATGGGLEGRLDGKLVWTAERFPDNRLRTTPQITLRRAITE
jgi:hypothetical protein